MDRYGILFLTLFFICFFCIVRANNGVFLTPSTAWVDGFGYEQDGRYKIDNVKLFFNTTAGDTLINNNSYFRIRRAKICKTHCELDVDDEGNEFYRDMRIDTHDSNLQFFMREDEEGNVWFYTEDKNVFYELSGNTLYEYLADGLVGRDLFLFNAKNKYAIGDKLSLGGCVLNSPDGYKEGEDYWGQYSFEVNKTDEISLLDGKSYTLYNICFLARLGPLDGPLSGIGAPNSSSADLNQLFAFYKGGQLIYRNEGYLSALEEYFPNILDIVTGDNPNNIGGLYHLQPDKSSAIYDLQGRKVNSQFLKGLYIVNGKKVAAK